MRFPIVVFLAAGIVFGQAKAAYRAPRTPDGQPDLQGIWMARGGAAGSLEDHSAALGILAGRASIVDPPGGVIPYKPEALKKRDQNFKTRHTADPLGKCFQPGVPRVMYIPYPFQIFQTRDFFVILSEFAHAQRTVFYKGEHPEELELWMGDSRAKWEGETLVVSVGSNHPDTWLDQSGNHHSAAMTVTERFTRVSPNEIAYEATIEDPETYTRPWRIRVPLARQTDRTQLYEYECHVYLEDERDALKEKK